MKLPDDEKRQSGISVTYMAVGLVVFVVIVLAVVLVANYSKNSNQGSAYVQNALQEQEETDVSEEDTATSGSTLRAEDLDFWDMYPEEGDEDEESVTVPEPEEVETIEETVEDDPATDGKHTLVTYADGSEEWVLISPYLTKNTYDFSGLSTSSYIKKYTENGKKISYLGLDVSKRTTAVSFDSVKAAGVDYVMIRVGARGYATGQLSLDDNFTEMIEGAIDAGLDIGVYFYSQAISDEEATEELNFVLENIEPYREYITYPVAFDMEAVANTASRIDSLTKTERTSIAETFLEGVTDAGYIPMLCGNKEWLIKNVDLSSLQKYDVWLFQEQDEPDYPYQFVMWRYTTTGILGGVTGDADLSLCFVSYADR